MPRKNCRDCGKPPDEQVGTDCTRCRKNADARKWADANRERVREENRKATAKWRLAHPDAKRAETKSYYHKNRVMLLKKDRQRHLADPSKGAKRARKHYHKDIEASRAQSREYYLANRDKLIQKVVERQKAFRRAAWANPDAVAAIYVIARRMTKATGTPYQVDHIIPLRGKSVCGLHVETNLQIMPAADNKAKGNKLIHI